VSRRIADIIGSIGSIDGIAVQPAPEISNASTEQSQGVRRWARPSGGSTHSASFELFDSIKVKKLKPELVAADNA